MLIQEKNEIQKFAKILKQLGPIEIEILISNAQVLLARQQIGRQIEGKKIIENSKIRYKTTTFQNNLLDNENDIVNHIY